MTEAGLRQAKLVLLGDMGAGKSSLVIRFVKGQYFDHLESTIGAAFLTKAMPEHGVKFEIWDTAGQERYHSLAPMYYRGAAAAVVVYDIGSAESFAKAQAWVRELQRQGAPGAVIALAGNKADLGAEGRAVSADEAKAYAAENGLHFWETSAKTGDNVAELFADVAARLPRGPTPGGGGGAGAGGPLGAAPPAAPGLTLEAAAPARPARSACC